MRIPFLVTILGTATASLTTAATVSVTNSTLTNIPDGNSSGVISNLTVFTGGGNISTITVDLQVTNTGGAFLGDLYVYLTNGSKAAILVNRPGRSTTSSTGYSDDQTINVTFSPLAANDIHTYRLPVTGSNSAALTAPLTGTWQPDGRATDPGSVLTADARTAGLEMYAGDAADGTWTLFAADLSTGATHKITSWSLNVTTATIPEPSVMALGLTALLASTGRRRRTA